MIDTLSSAPPGNGRCLFLCLWVRLALIQVMVDQHGVVVAGGGNAVEQSRQEIGFRVPDAGGVLPDAVHDLLNVFRGDSSEPILDVGGGIFRLPSQPDGLALVHGYLQHDLHQFVQRRTIAVREKVVIADLFPDFLPHIPSVCQSFRFRRKD